MSHATAFGAHLGVGLPRWCRLLGLGLSLLGLTTPCVSGAQPPAPPSDPVVALPPMIIMESAKAPPWLYTTAGGQEFLSRCSAGTTRDYVAAQLRSRQLLELLVPPEFLARKAIPVVSLVVPQSMMAKDDAMFDQVMGEAQEELRRRVGADARWKLPEGKYQFLPNMRLDDRDMSAGFTFWDEGKFDPGLMIVADVYVRALLAQRQPMLPQWLIDGATGLYQQTDLRDGQVTFRPFRWISPEETTALQRDPESRRAMITTVELFSPGALIGPANQHESRQAIWRLQAALFVRWALDPANGLPAGALWKFAERASREATTERVFTECFGLGYTDLMDRLSDYLPVAVANSVPYATATKAVEKFEVVPATELQIARLRGEWERLEIGAVREKHPQFLPRYVDQARLTIRRATSRGEKDPQLLATAALCELDAGDAVAAQLLLEQAAEARVVRPRVYLELARLRWLELTRDAPATRKYKPEQLRPIIDVLRRGFDQAPLLPETLLMMTDAWLRSEEPISSVELELLARRVPEFRRYPIVAFQVALVHLTLGKRLEAAVMLTEALPFVTDQEMRARYGQLLGLLTEAKAKG